MTDLTVVVIIVTYKVAELTIACLRSIALERSSPGVCISVIVVDNASGDASQISAAIVENGWCSWVSLWVAPKNGGFAYGNNQGLRMAYAKGAPDYFFLLNPDTEVRRGAIKVLVSFLEAHPEVGIAGSSLEGVDGVVWPGAFRFPSLLGEIESGLQWAMASRLLSRWTTTRRMGAIAAKVDWVPGASMMVRRHLVDIIGGMDEGFFLYYEETEFSFRASKSGFATWYVPDGRVMHISGESTKAERGRRPRGRLPGYVFESRRRWFVGSYGLAYAVATDVCAITAHVLGLFKRCLLRQVGRSIPSYIRDLVHHSPLWKRNRIVVRPICFRPTQNHEPARGESSATFP